MTDKSLTASNLEKTVSDFLLLNGDWNKEKLRRYLPEDICTEVFNFQIRGNINEEDSIIWNHPKEVEFSVKSAYRFLEQDGQPRIEKHWDLIWRWPGNQRNRTFQWLCAKNKILTNLKRRKRNLTIDSLYPICRMEDESVMHAVSDCPSSKNVWKTLIQPAYWDTFFRGDTVEWIIYNSKREIGKINDINWKLTFGEAVRRL